MSKLPIHHFDRVKEVHNTYHYEKDHTLIIMIVPNDCHGRNCGRYDIVRLQCWDGIATNIGRELRLKHCREIVKKEMTEFSKDDPYTDSNGVLLK